MIREKKFHLLITSSKKGATQDATTLVQSFTWAGDVGQCARTLDFPLLVSEMDKGLAVVPCELGSRVHFYQGDELLFDGFVFSCQRNTTGNTIEVGCVDRGIYLKRNAASYKFKNQTPEAITRRLCGDFSIPIGTLAETGISVSRNFPGVSLYQMIQTAYTLAAESTGEKYTMRFRGEALEVKTKKQGPKTLVLLPGSNLIGATVSESVEDMVNQVALYDENDNPIGTEKNEEAIALYGLMQGYLKKSKDQDASAQAKQMLEEGGVSQKITVTNLGNTALTAGECVVLREPVTGQYGLFWIDSDTHTWKDGLYQNKLVLNFRNIMDEQEAGSLPKG